MRHVLSLFFCAALAGLCVGIAWLIDGSGLQLFGLPLLASLALLSFLIQWLAFIPAFAAQTELYYDLIGSATYATLTWLALAVSGLEPRNALIGVLVSIWFLRLGSFLFRRVRRDGKDGRFDEIKPNFGRFLVAWSLQGVWVFLTLLAALIAITSQDGRGIDGFAVAGTLIWFAGIAIEAIADAQKSAFKSHSDNLGRFIQSGLWAWSRHPNYFGEIVLWCGICVIAWPSFSGWENLGLISPVFVAFLLIKVSGIPLLEARADKTWGGEGAYEEYKRNTPTLILRPPRKAQ